VSDELPTGPSLLAPGAPQPRLRGEQIARAVILPLVGVLMVVILVFYVLFQAIRVDGPSMAPTLLSDDRLLVTKGEKQLQRGDVIVVTAPEGGTDVELVKRVIGLPGDTVEVRNGIAYVNGQREPERGQQVFGRDSHTWDPVTVPSGRLYVMGDNRILSEDSRYLGTVAMSDVVGKVVFVFAPVDRIHVVD
jgi:signal peptidase I